jgi:rod shape-determining protein MreC
MRVQTKSGIDYSKWLLYFVISGVMLGVDALGWFSGLKTISDRINNPISRGIRSSIEAVGRPWESVRFMVRGPKKLEDLESRYAEALVKIEEVENLREENESLRKLLGSGSLEEFSYEPVSVVGGHDEVVLGEGSVSGVKPGDVVVDASHVLVGRVVRVSAWTSWVTTAAYTYTQVPVKIGSQEVLGILVGTGDEAVVEVEQADQVFEGDMVITSGSANEYVPGILVGRVTRVEAETAHVMKKVMVDVLAEPGETVFIVRGSNE